MLNKTICSQNESENSIKIKHVKSTNMGCPANDWEINKLVWGFVKAILVGVEPRKGWPESHILVPRLINDYFANTLQMSFS